MGTCQFDIRLARKLKNPLQRRQRPSIASVGWSFTDDRIARKSVSATLMATFLFRHKHRHPTAQGKKARSSTSAVMKCDGLQTRLRAADIVPIPDF